MQRKALFFDIDGTLMDSSNHIPDSTIEAIAALKKNGHLVFLNSGRTRGYIRLPALLDLGFDGIISGCSTMIEFHDDVVFYYEMELELAQRTISTVIDFGFKPILEGKDYLYLEEDHYPIGDWYGDKLRRDLAHRLLGIYDNWDRLEISKMSCSTIGADRYGCYETLKDRFDFIVHNEFVSEIVPKGFHKGTGIEKICEILHMDIQDTLAFGDGMNDMEMIKTAHTGIILNSGAARAREAADYIAPDYFTEDGIWKTCKYFSLI